MLLRNGLFNIHAILTNIFINTVDIHGGKSIKRPKRPEILDKLIADQKKRRESKHRTHKKRVGGYHLQHGTTARKKRTTRKKSAKAQLKSEITKKHKDCCAALKQIKKDISQHKRDLKSLK